MNELRKFCFGLITLVFLLSASAGSAQNSRVVEVAKGWASNSVNTVVFRKSSLTSFKGYQFIAFYDSLGHVVLGKRKNGSANWQLKTTNYKGNVRDAHNSISIMVDGDGILHMAWDHHNTRLRYCRSRWPFSLELTEEMPMTGVQETKLSYPEFYRLPDGDLLFFYRDGGSGNGNMVINRYSRKERIWARVQTNLLDGEGRRNAYWQSYVDGKGIIYLSWVWRESPDVASNHDLCFAKSTDGGLTWEKSTGEKYTLPINAANAEYAWTIPQKSELINQTSMHADKKGNIVIATYWRSAGDSVPQYQLVYRLKDGWKNIKLDFRKTAFSLSGMGSKKIPIARPQVLIRTVGKKTKAWMFFRDEERQNKVSVVTVSDLNNGRFTVTDLYSADTGSWEPSLDSDLWKSNGQVNLFVQRTVQADSEGLTTTPAQSIRVLEWKPKN